MRKKSCTALACGGKKVLQSFWFYLKSRKKKSPKRKNQTTLTGTLEYLFILQCRYQADHNIFARNNTADIGKDFFITTLDYLISRIACSFS